MKMIVEFHCFALHCKLIELY